MLKSSMQQKNNKIKLAVCISGLLLMFMARAWGGIMLNENLHTIWVAAFACILPYEGVLYLSTILLCLCSLTTHFAHVFLVLFAIIFFKRVVLRRGGSVRPGGKEGQRAEGACSLQACTGAR